jgi:NADPH:quinone reductase-like Zn-dependent oxidoreductase
MRIPTTLALLATLAATVPAAHAAPAKMQAWVQTGPDNLSLQTVDTPKPGPGEVLIKVYAAGINPVDWKRIPQAKTMPDGTVRAAIPGFDVAGVIDSVGPGVTTPKPGDAVYARPDGAYAQYITVAASDAVPKPRRLTFIEAAAVPIAGAAGYGVAKEAGIKPGQRVAIIGAAGGAGSAAVDFVHGLGGKVIASAHSSQAQFLQSMGVEEIVAYDKDDVAARIHDVDVAINTADGQADKALGYVKKGGRLVSITGMPSPERCTAAQVTCIQLRGNAEGLTYPDSLRAIAPIADAGRYRPRVTKTFPLAEAPAAQQFAHAGNTTGKVVLIVDPKGAAAK